MQKPVKFSESDCEFAERLVKTAYSASAREAFNAYPEMQAAMGPGSYDALFGKPVEIRGYAPPTSGFFGSLGRTLWGAAQKAPVTSHLMGLTGLHPDVQTSGISTFLGEAPSLVRSTVVSPFVDAFKGMGDMTAYERLASDTAKSRGKSMDIFRQGYKNPIDTVRAGGDRDIGAFGKYWEENDPLKTKALSKWWTSPTKVQPPVVPKPKTP